MKPHRVIVFEDAAYRDLLPLVYWRAVAELRCGRCTLLARHRSLAGAVTDLWTRRSLADVAAERLGLPVNVPAEPRRAGTVLLINARYLPGPGARLPRPGTVGLAKGQLALALLPAEKAAALTPETTASLPPGDQPFAGADLHDVDGEMIDHPWDLVLHNEARLRQDWSGAAECRGFIAPGAHLVNPGHVFIGPDARVMPGAVLDASEGPIHVGAGVTVSSLVVVQGPASLGDRTIVQPGAVIRHGCSIGPVCKVGGELESTILQGFSNKQHDGFLGHAYVGSWVNLGADTVNSDLKNTYGTVRVPINAREIDSGQTFVGAFIGDHAKTGIGQTLPTGCVLGFGANVATSAFAPKFVPSFTWITDRAVEPYDPPRCLAVARKVMARRKVTMTAAEEALFLRLPALCAEHEHAVAPPTA